MATPEELLTQAAALDDEAARLRGGDERSRELRRRAADLRVQALEPRPYPVLVCSVCSLLTGWVGADGACVFDVRRRLESADPNHLGVPDLRVRPAPERLPLLGRVKRGLGIGSSRDRARAWLTKIEPGTTGPVEPEDGWALEWPLKVEARAPEGPHLLVLFDVQSYRFEYGAWHECASTPGGKPPRLVPREFPASLPIDALAEAWNDFEAEVARHNELAWAAEQSRRAGVAQGARERAAAYESEHGTSELLG
ncbi:MAG TPA: hypothetical protein VJ814_09740 [Gaiellaceae bacterium]|nr:hypothetical protein [Gaiellaceae bacterium]